MIEILIMGVVAMIFSVILHEIGHLLYFERIGRKVKIRYYFDSWRKFGIRLGKDSDYNKLTSKQYRSMIMLGVLFGVIPILFVSIMFFPYVLLIIPYLFGCAHDFRLYKRSFKW